MSANIPVPGAGVATGAAGGTTAGGGGGGDGGGGDVSGTVGATVAVVVVAAAVVVAVRVVATGMVVLATVVSAAVELVAIVEGLSTLVGIVETGDVAGPAADAVLATGVVAEVSDVPESHPAASITIAKDITPAIRRTGRCVRRTAATDLTVTPIGPARSAAPNSARWRRPSVA